MKALGTLFPARLFLLPLLAVVLTGIVFVRSASSDGAIGPVPDLENIMPDSFAGWRTLPVSDAVKPLEDITADGQAVLYRAYASPAGERVTLVLAYGPALGDAVRLHRPEVCYRALGYEVVEVARSDKTEDASLPVIRMTAENHARREAVSYWLRSGEMLTRNEAWQQMSNLFAGQSDSMLVRLSSPGEIDENTIILHDRFLKDLVENWPREHQQLLLPTRYWDGLK